MTYIPYCGSPPVPGGLVWNLDPVLIGALLALAGAHLWAMPRAHSWRRASVIGGWMIVSLALISPLCNLSVSLFSARVTQHMIITLIGAPLIAFGLDFVAPARRRFFGDNRYVECVLAMSVFAIALWTWHLPGPYDATLKSDIIYWTMHITMFAAALWLWLVLLDGDTMGVGASLVAAMASGFQMSVLGAILALNNQALFAVHFGTTMPWGLTPLQDQELGGLIMWVPGGLLLTAYAIFAFGIALRRMDAAESVSPIA